MKRLIKVLSIFTVMFALSNSAHAILSLTFTDMDTMDTTSVTDNGTGDFMGIYGWLSTIGSIGNWSIDTTAYGEGFVGSANTDEIDLASSNVKYDGGVGDGVFRIELLQTGITKDAALFSIGLGGTAAGTIQFDSYINNVLVSESGKLEGAFSFEDYGMVAGGIAPYEYKVVATIVSGLRSESSFNYKVTIPEPSTLGLLGLGICGLALYARRRRQA